MSVIGIFTYILRLIVFLPLSWLSGPIFIICELLSYFFFAFFLLEGFVSIGGESDDKFVALAFGIMSFIFYIIPRVLLGITAILDPTND